MNIGFVGMGSIGQMLVTSLVQAGAIPPGSVFASNRSQEKLKRFAAAVPGIQAADNTHLVQQCPVVFLCVKPGETRAVLDDVGPYITAEHLLVTVTNAIDIAALEQAVPARVAKVIPSLVHAVGGGVSLLMFGSRCTPEDRVLLHRLFGAISHPEVILESQARVASDLTSCGPAFLSYVFRALAQAARHYQPDLTPETVDMMIRLTALATCRLMEQTGTSFDEIVARVSTPGGVTADGIQVLDEQLAGVWEEVIETTIRKEASKKAKVNL